MSNPPAERQRCGQCGSELAPALLCCPGCGWLVYAERLKALASEAEQAEQKQDLPGAFAAWRQALELLPPGTRQYQFIAARIDDLGQQSPAALSTSSAAPATPGGKARAGGLAGIGVFVVFVLTKAKFLLLGLTKASTFLSMFLSMGVYWTAYGWKFALGLVLSIYVHEMGHVAALRRFGFRATAPMFIPGFGAIVRLRQHPVNPVENARIGLAGPIWGLGAAMTALGVYGLTDWQSWLAIARVGAWINLFNLIPIWQLDGGRGFSSLTRPQRWLAVAAIAIAWYFTSEGLLLLLLVGDCYQALQRTVPTRPDWVGFLQYVALVGILSAMCLLAPVVPER
jgi:Zn-dependent protease